MLQAFELVEPWGDEREDMRMRSFLQNFMAAQAIEPPERPLRYLPIHAEAEDEPTIEATRDNVQAAIEEALH